MSDLPPLPLLESYPEQLQAVVADARSRLRRTLTATSLESLDTLAGAARALEQRVPAPGCAPHEDPNGNLLAAAVLELCSTGAQILTHYNKALSEVITPDDPALDAIRGTTPDSVTHLLRDLMRDYKAMMAPQTANPTDPPEAVCIGDIPRYGQLPTLDLTCTVEAARRPVNSWMDVWLVCLHAAGDTIALSLWDTKQLLDWAGIETRRMALISPQARPLIQQPHIGDRNIRFDPNEAEFNLTFEGDLCVVRIPMPELHQPLVLNITGPGLPRRIRVPREDLVRVTEEVATHMGVL